MITVKQLVTELRQTRGLDPLFVCGSYEDEYNCHKPEDLRLRPYDNELICEYCWDEELWQCSGDDEDEDSDEPKMLKWKELRKVI